MAQVNKYAVAAEQVLAEIGGGPVRSGELVDLIKEKGLLPPTENPENFYHYVLKACKDSDVFDTSARGRIGLANNVAVQTVTEEV